MQKFKLPRTLMAAFIMLALGVFLTVISSLNRSDLPAAGDGVHPGREVRVTRVIDGDTLDVTRKGGQERVRLYGIDAPERSQPYGEASRQQLAQWVDGRTVCLADRGADRYGRALAELYVTDPASSNAAYCGVPVNRVIVKSGV